MDYHRFQRIIKGDFNDIPREKSKMVRIFLSSTFSDTHAERDYLIEHIYPKLKTYCKTTYGLDFQILDMRWGISHEATNKHMATTISLNEIKTCQKYSVGPNFIALLSHRYGACVLPSRILAKEYEIIRNELSAIRDQFDLTYKFDEKEYLKSQNVEEERANYRIIEIENIFEFCYELDENEKPERYRLKYLDKIIPEYKEKDPIVDIIWSAIESKLGTLLKSMAEHCLNKGLFNQTQYERYFVSVTEKEIFNGILNGKDIKDNTLFFVREIEDIEENIHKNKALSNKFIELNKNGEIDTKTKTLLDNLKYKKIPEKLPDSNIFRFNVKWSSSLGISLETHPDYIKNFAETFYEQTKLLIDRNQSKKTDFSHINKEDQILLQEVLDHATFCMETAEKFHGREDLLETVKEYILNEEKDTPFFVFGQSGCGKTAILAKITSQILKVVPDPQNYVVLLRFLGTTPSTSNIIKTFNSITYQLARIFNFKVNTKPLTSKLALRDYLLMQLMMINMEHPNKKVIIILDSLDQLSPDDYSLDWIFQVLPKNIKMIYSSLPEHAIPLSSYFERFKKTNDTYVNVQSLDKNLSILILQDLLSKANRQISENQLKTLQMMFETAVLYPLYVKLIFDIVENWTSFYDPDAAFKKCMNIDSCVKYLFQRLEEDHGKLLFSRAIIYMSSFQNGISESEIEDILSLDDDVLYDIFEFHAPPVRKLPLSLWSRIKHDLKGYMVEKEIDDTRVIYWYHRRFIEVANSYYISKMGSAERETVFMNVVDFFNETWKNKPKPYKYNEYVAKKKKLKSNESQEVRNTTMQPTLFVGPDGRIKYNKRKITEFPSFISQLTTNLAVPLACEHVFFNYEFITGLFTCSSFNEIMGHLERLTQGSSYNMLEKRALSELKMMSLIFLQASSLMGDFPTQTASFILTRALRFNNYFKFFTQLIDQYDRFSYKQSALIVPCQFLQTPGADLILQLDNHSFPIRATVIGGDDDGFTFTLSNKLIAFNMENLKISGEILMPISNIPFQHLVVYFARFEEEAESLLKNITGGFLVSNTKELISYKFDSQIYFRKQFDNSTIECLYLLSSNHVLVQFKDENFFEIYNIFTSELVLRKSFSSKIVSIACNHPTKIILCLDMLKNTTIVLGLESQDIYLFHFKSSSIDNSLSFTEKNSNEIKLEEIRHIEPTGIPIRSISFLEDNKTEQEIFLTSFDDGSMLFIDHNPDPKFEPEENLSMMLIKPKNNLEDRKHIYYKFVDYSKDSFLLLGSNHHLYVLLPEFANKKMIEIKGKFDGGAVLDTDKVAGFSKGNILLFKVLKIETKNATGKSFAKFKVVQLSSIEAHFDYISFFIVKDQMILTSSLDTTLRCFWTTGWRNTKDILIKFDRTEKDITNIYAIDHKHVLTKTENSNKVQIWKCSNLKIVENLELEHNDVIMDVFYFNQKLLVVSKLSETYEKHGHILVIRMFSIKTNSSKFSFHEDFKINVFRQKMHRIIRIDSESNNDFFLLTEQEAKAEINVFEINYNKMKKHYETNRHNLIKMEANSVINLEDKKILFDTKNESLLDNSCLTHKNKLLVLFVGCELIFVRTSDGEIVFTKSFDQFEINLEYFISPTNLIINKLVNVTPIKDTDSLVAINNLNELLLLNFDMNNANKLKLIRSSVSTLANNLAGSFESFKVNGNILLAIDSLNKFLIGFDVNSVIQANSFAKCLFRIKLKENLSNDFSFISLDYGLSPNFEYCYVIFNKKLLRLYRAKEQSQMIGEMPLYGKARCALCTNEFVALGMQDNRVCSYLIVDPNDPQGYQKILELESREKTIDKKQKIQNEILINSSEQNMENSSDEDDSDLQDCFRDEESFNKFTKVNDSLNKTEESEAKEDDDEVYERNIKERNKIQLLHDLKKTLQNKKPIQYLQKQIKSKELKNNWLLELLRKDFGKEIGKYIKTDKNSEFSNETSVTLLEDKTQMNTEDLNFKQELTSFIQQTDNEQLNTKLPWNKNVKISNPPSSKACLLQ